MSVREFFTLPDGRTARLFRLRSKNGELTADISDFGGVLYALTFPGGDGIPVDVVLGYRDPHDYLACGTYFGALVGRVANRIAGASFTLDGLSYQLVANEKPNSLHGGIGFSHRLWEVRDYREDLLALRLFSPDGEGGYPGDLTVDAVYRVTSENALELELQATTSATTVVNLTGHAYFNLNGEGSGSIAGQVIQVNAAERQEVGADLIPTGRLLPVAETAYDLRRARRFDELLAEFPNGLDDNFRLPGPGGVMQWMATAFSEKTGIRLDLAGTDIAVQLYTGGGLNGTDIGKNGRAYERFGGFCLEPQHLIDSPHHAAFPSIRLEPGERYCQKIEYRFSRMPA